MEKITNEQYARLLQTKKDIDPFSFDGKTVYAKVVEVYDGDTCKINMYLHANILAKFTVRMMGYDCPEIKTKNSTEKKFAIRSKTILSSLILDKIVKLECLKFDKYGRILGRITTKDEQNNDVDVNAFMINNQLGYGYEGETKKNFNDLLNNGYYREDNILIPETQNYQVY
jgi:endonuclease YncB( thermonuclease family)